MSALNFLTAARNAMPKTLGDRDRVAAMNGLMRTAIDCRMGFARDDATALASLGEQFCVGVFRPMDENWYVAACKAGGTYIQMWEKHCGVKPWIASLPAPEDPHGPMQENVRAAPGMAILLDGQDDKPNLPRSRDKQVWWITSFQWRSDALVVCRYPLEEGHANPFIRSSGSKLLARRRIERAEWDELFPRKK